MPATERRTELASHLQTLTEFADGPVSVSVATGEVRSVADRVERIRAAHPSASRGSCQSVYSTWGD